MLKASFSRRLYAHGGLLPVRIKQFTLQASGVPPLDRPFVAQHLSASVPGASPPPVTTTRFHPEVSRSRRFTTSRSYKMASDEDYMSFLDKANQDPSAGLAKSAASTKHEFKTTDSDVHVPAVLKSVVKDAFYTSDADEPFVPVCLRWNEDGKGLPDEEEFASLISHPNPSGAKVEIQDPADWDSQGQYGEILDAVRKAGKGNDVRVYRIIRDGTRVEYWVVTTEGKGKDAKLVGVKALAIES